MSVRSGQLPPPPPLSPLAEVVINFEESEPDACKLLRPFKDGLTAGELEVRARRAFPNGSAERRAQAIARAKELLELARTENSGGKAPVKRIGIQTIPPEQRERLRQRLSEAIRENPGMTIEEGRQLLNREPGISIPDGTFYGGYWKPAMQLLPPDVLEVRKQLTARRAGEGQLNTSDSQRKKVRRLVAELKRDHPAMKVVEMMDVARDRTGLNFRDPLSFKRYYVDPVEPAPPAPRGRHSRNTAPRRSARTPADAVKTSPPNLEDAPANTPDAGGPPLMSWLNPLAPARLDAGEDGLVHLVLDSGPLPRATAFRRMAAIFTALAEAEPV